MQIKGFTHNGAIAAYSEVDPNGAAMETFPLAIPDGVTVEPYDGTGVHIWTSLPSGSSKPLIVIEAAETDAGNVTPTIIKNLTLGGGEAGIRLSAEWDGDLALPTYGDVLLRNIRFQGNQTGLDVLAGTGGSLSVSVEQCKVTNLPVDIAITVKPRFTPPQVGLRFHSSHFGPQPNPGLINAQVLNLKCLGATPATSPLPYLAPTDVEDMYGSTAASRLIEVAALGSTTSEHAAMSPGIPEVNLQVLNGDLDGKFNGTSGWDIGLYAAATSPTQTNADDYVAGYEVLFSGTEIQGFRNEGVYATARTDTRGHVDFQDVDIHNIGGDPQEPGQNPPRHNGVHGFVLEGYLALTGNGLHSHHNVGVGFLANSAGTILDSAATWPTGLYVGVQDSEFDTNQRGMVLAGPGALSPGAQGGVVGGTWDYRYGIRSLVRDGSKPFDLDYGQGFADRSTFHDNDEQGIMIRLANGPTAPDFASIRFVNCIAWNNPQGAFHAQATNSLDAYFLTPILHSTFADNGQQSGFTLEVEKVGGSGALLFEYDDPSFQENPKMKILNSIFQRDVLGSQDYDFGAGLHSLAVVDGTGTNTEIGANGLRLNYQGTIPFDESTDREAPFAHLSQPSLLGPQRYFLDINGANISFFANRTPMSYSIVNETESNVDFTGFKARLSRTSGLRDKGAHEVQ